MSVVMVTVVSVSFQPGPQALAMPMKPEMAANAEKDFILMRMPVELLTILSESVEVVEVKFN